jgi:hypothetical protein
MTNNPDSVSVDPEEVRKHADSVEALMGSLDKCLEATNYLTSADDGYGNWLRPAIKGLFAGRLERTANRSPKSCKTA